MNKSSSIKAARIVWIACTVIIVLWWCLVDEYLVDVSTISPTVRYALSFLGMVLTFGGFYLVVSAHRLKAWRKAVGTSARGFLMTGSLQAIVILTGICTNIAVYHIAYDLGSKMCMCVGAAALAMCFPTQKAYDKYLDHKQAQ